MKFTKTEEQKIKAFGVEGEDKIGLWSLMQLTCPRDLSKEPDIRNFLRTKSITATPDERVKELFEYRITLLKGAK